MTTEIYMRSHDYGRVSVR